MRYFYALNVDSGEVTAYRSRMVRDLQCSTTNDIEVTLRGARKCTAWNKETVWDIVKQIPVYGTEGKEFAVIQSKIKR